MTITIRAAMESDAAAIAGVLTAAADDLTARYGNGHWSHGVSEATAMRALKSSTVLVAVEGEQVIGTLRLTTKKPWAIDAGYFAPVKRAIYLLDMSVAPSHQRSGVGRRLLAEARKVAMGWPGQAIRLDAYDAEAGAGQFYESCGYREVGAASPTEALRSFTTRDCSSRMRSRETTLSAVALDAMGVIYPVADDLRDLLIPYLRTRGCELTDDELVELFRACYRHGAPARELWQQTGCDWADGALETDFLGLYELRPGLIEFLQAMRAASIPVYGLSNDVAVGDRAPQELRNRRVLRRLDRQRRRKPV